MADIKTHQWVIDKDGMETYGDNPLYYIEASRLFETTYRNSVLYYDWILQLAEKNWVLFDDFVVAFRKATKVHAKKLDGPLDEAMLNRSIDYARKENHL